MAASMWGGNDNGRGLSPGGREFPGEAIRRNQVELIEESSLEDNIRQRIEIFDRARGEREIKAFVNIGEGLASIGSSQNPMPPESSRNPGSQPTSNTLCPGFRPAAFNTLYGFLKIQRSGLSCIPDRSKKQSSSDDVFLQFYCSSPPPPFIYRYCLGI
jgi:hypothetical protein